jgi:hypothetical protein
MTSSKVLPCGCLTPVVSSRQTYRGLNSNYLATLSPVAFAFLTVELVDSIMDLQHVVDVAESASISAEVPGRSAFMPCKSKGAYLFLSCSLFPSFLSFASSAVRICLFRSSSCSRAVRIASLVFVLFRTTLLYCHVVYLIFADHLSILELIGTFWSASSLSRFVMALKSPRQCPASLSKVGLRGSGRTVVNQA